ncbi:MAG: CHAT domain-containing protein [Cypionkella sp.]
MRCILIVPFSEDLATLPAEAQEVANILQRGGTHTVYLVQGVVTRADLMRAAREGPFDLVWVAAHADKSGLLLSKGALWTMEGLAVFLERCGAAVVVLNACFSAQLVVDLQRFATVGVVAAIAPEGVTDADAWEQAVYLAEAIHGQPELERLPDAVRSATAGGAAPYRWFPAARETIKRSNMAQGEEDLRRAILGDTFSGAPGLLVRLGRLETQVSDLVAAVTRWQHDTEMRILELERRRSMEISGRTAYWGVVIFGLLLLLIFVFIYYSGNGGL